MTNPDFTSINVIIDESGSMSHLRSDTIGGFNTFLEEQKKLPGKATVTLTTFNSFAKVLYENVPLEVMQPLTDLQYLPSGGTALYDAIGNTVNVVGARFAAMKEEDRPGKVVFLIITDGQENISKEFTQPSVKHLVEHQQQKYKWDFVFLAANIDAASTGRSLGVSARNSVQYTASSAGSQQLYSTVSAGMSSYRLGEEQTKGFVGLQDIQVKEATIAGVGVLVDANGLPLTVETVVTPTPEAK